MSRFITQDKGIIEDVDKYRSAQSMEVLSKEEKDEARQHILAYMNKKGVEKMEAGNSLVTLTRFVSVKFDVIAFRKAHPDLAQEFTQEVENMRFTVKDA